MKVSELKNKILTKAWLFRFISPNPLKKNDFGWKTLDQVEKEYGGFESYLKKIAESQNLKQLNIQAKSKNGSGFLNRGIFLVEIEPIDNVEKVEEQKKVESIGSINQNTVTQKVVDFDTAKSYEVKNEIPITNTVKTPMEDLKTHIENASMKTELMFLKQDNERLKESNKKLDQKNEELFNEVSKLTRELATDKEKNNLEFQRKELELLSKQKGGLSGIVEEVKNLDPKTIALFGSFLQPNNKNFQKFLEDGSGGEGGDASLNGPKHENSDTQDFIQHSIIPMLAEAPSGVVGMIGGLIEYFIKYPDHLVATYKKWLPGADINPKKGTNGTDGTGGTDDDLDEDEK